MALNRKMFNRVFSVVNGILSSLGMGLLFYLSTSLFLQQTLAGFLLNKLEGLLGMEPNTPKVFPKHVLFFPMFAFPALNMQGTMSQASTWMYTLKGIVYSEKYFNLRNSFQLITGGLDCNPAELPTLHQRLATFGTVYDEIVTEGIQICPVAQNAFTARSCIVSGGEQNSGGQGLELNGFFEITQPLAVPPQSQGGTAFMTQLLPPSNQAQLNQATLELVQLQGVSVISDIDDTIKVTGVLADKSQLLRNVLCSPYRSVRNMPAVYNQWSQQLSQTSGVTTFHYVSASPWHLLPPLQQYLLQEGFPLTSLHLRNFPKLSPLKIMQFLDTSPDYKVQEITRIMTQLQGRKFILVGDATEKDPEVYGQIERQFGNAVQCIFIRNVPIEYRNEQKYLYKSTPQRFQAAFAGVPETKISFFEDGVELGEMNLQTCQPLQIAPTLN